MGGKARSEAVDVFPHWDLELNIEYRLLEIARHRSPTGRCEPLIAGLVSASRCNAASIADNQFLILNSR